MHWCIMHRAAPCRWARLTFTLAFHQMNEVLNELSKPVWWVSVVIAGIIINLISAYLKTRLDKTLGGFSNWWAARSAKRQREWSERVERIRSSTSELSYEIALETRHRLQSIEILLFAILLILQLVLIESIRADVSREVKIFFLAVSSLGLFASFLAFQSAVRAAKAIESARKSANLSSRRTADGAA